MKEHRRILIDVEVSHGQMSNEHLRAAIKRELVQMFALHNQGEQIEVAMKIVSPAPSNMAVIVSRAKHPLSVQFK